MDLTRREVLRIIGVSAAGTLIGTEAAEASTGTSAEDVNSYALLNDGTKCIGCRSCERACREFNGLPDPETLEDGTIVNPTDLDSRNFTYIEPREIPGENPGDPAVTTYRRHMCNHCIEPSCASACPVAALHKTEEGPVHYRAERCIGCRYCLVACPFGIPSYDWDKWKPFVKKCTMCYEKVKNGEPTSCASACPVGAITFGRRQDLVAEAHRRINADPDRYFPHIYGENEAGGTGVMYLSSSLIPMTEFGFRDDVGMEPYPGFTWAALSRVPGLATFVVLWMITTYFITHRRIPELEDDTKT